MRTNEEINLLPNDYIRMVDHWGYDDGKPEDNGVGQHGQKLGATGGRTPGHYCWIYPRNKDKLEKWMSENCPGAVYDFRFNSGDPMYTTHFPNDKEAMLFKLKFLG
jgi:hypothetical protein